MTANQAAFARLPCITVPLMKKILFLFSATLATFSAAQAQSPDSVYDAFLNPPAAARPRVWWHWMNGNITREGIRKDLLWMKRSGIGGFQNFDASLLTPQIVEKRLTYMTPEWKEAFRYTTHLADSLKLEMAIAGSPGWSESGGPWVTPEDGMKKLVWSETFVKGGASKIKLQAPPGVTGPFQNLPMPPDFGAAPDRKPPQYFRDIAVIAYKVPATDLPVKDLKPKVSSSAGHFEIGQLTDGDLATTVLLPRDSVKGFAWIQFEFAQPITVKALTVVGGGDRGPFGLNGEMKDTRSLMASDDGENFKQVCFVPAGNILQQTISVPPTTAKYFRVTFKNLPATGGMMSMFGAPSKPPAGIDIGELVLHTGPRIHWAEEKAAFAPAMELSSKVTPAATDVASPSDVVDLSSKLLPDGTLDWTAPAGNWKILRFGFSLIGKTNHPASPEATGLEVDKLDPGAVKRYFDKYLEQYQSATGGLMGRKGLQYIVTDSWEAGSQTWTPNLPAEFKKRRGYDMKNWMPVLTGQIIKSAEASEQFLFDFRKTLGDLVVEYHYDQLTDILKQRGMKRYSESHEDRRAMIADGMEVKRSAAIPMSAMWTANPFMNDNNQTKFESDIRESASVAHIYGQNLVAAESLTALGFPNTAWAYSPENLKPTADLELANGLNRFVIHTSVHQPVDKLPGLSLGPFGQWFNRLDTWAEQAKAWTDYLARSSYLLQQGRFVADVLYYYGEDDNITSLFGKGLPPIPTGYNFDFINADALVNLLSVKDGRLVTRSGMSYSLLVLDENAKKMSLPVLRKIEALVKAGAAIAGAKPEVDASLTDDPVEFKRLLGEIWGGNNPRVLTGKSLAEALSAMAVAPDMAIAHAKPDTKLLYVHRATPDRDIYWVNNRTGNVEDLELTFRVAGRVPELWFADTGMTESLAYVIANGVTKVKLHLEPNDALFVVFRNPASKPSADVPMPEVSELTTLQGSWNVSFQKERGAPSSVMMNELTSWTAHADAGVKYFSGTAAYTKTFVVNAEWLAKGREIWLSLGDVKSMAEVSVNGKSFGLLWKAPFRLNVTGALKAGENKLEIKVTNLWVNRLIGDAQPGVTGKLTFVTMPFYQGNSPLLPSGLLGPVKLLSLNRR